MSSTRRPSLAILLLLPGLLLLPLTWQAGLHATDTTIRSDLLPHLIYHNLMQAGQWPWLNPHAGLSRPLAADPQYAAWYPTTWLYALITPTEALPAILWLHYALLVCGTYRLARCTVAPRRSALALSITVGLLAALSLSTIKLTTLCAFAWTPFVLWSLLAYARSPSVGPASVLRLSLAALLLTLQSLAGAPQWAIITAIAAAALMLLVRRQPTTIILTRWLNACICAAGLGTIQWLPLLALMPHLDWTSQSDHLRQIPTQPLDDTSRIAAALRELRTSDARLWVADAPQTPDAPLGPLAARLIPRANTLQHIPTLNDPGPLQPTAQHAYLGLANTPTASQRDRLLHDPRWTRHCNVGWTLLANPETPPPADAKLVLTTRARERLYRQPLAGGWAMFADAAQPGIVRCLQHSPNHIALRVDTWPAAMNQPDQASAEHVLLLISQLALPGWSATHAGHQLPITRVDGLLLGLQLPAGRCLDIRCNYFPPGLIAGLTITLLCAAALATAVLLTLLRPQPIPPRRGATAL